MECIVVKTSKSSSFDVSFVQSSGKIFDEIIDLAHHLGYGLVSLNVILNVFSVCYALAPCWSRLHFIYVPFCFIFTHFNPLVLSLKMGPLSNFSGGQCVLCDR